MIKNQLYPIKIEFNENNDSIVSEIENVTCSENIDGLFASDDDNSKYHTEQKYFFSNQESKGIIPKVEESNGFNLFSHIETTPLHVAAAKGDVEKIKILLDDGWNINQENQKSAMPIALACTYGHVEAVKMLIKKGADLHDTSYEGQTALHWAILNTHADVVIELLKGGANPQAINYKNGENALKQAISQLNTLTDRLLDYPDHAPHIKEAYQLTKIIEHLSDYMPKPLLVALEKADNVYQQTPIAIFLEIFSSYVADNTLREYMQDTAQKIAQADPSTQEYILAKTFLNTFATGNNALVNLKNGDHPIMVHSDGFYAKYIAQAITQSLQEYSQQLLSEQKDLNDIKIFENIAQSYNLATQYAQSFVAKETAQLALKHYNLGETVILPTGWRGHCVSAIFSKSQNIVAIANAGQHYMEEPSGVIFYKLADAENITEDTFHKILTNQKQYGLEFIHHHELGIESCLGSIKTPPQTHGNCTHYSFKISVEAALFIEYLNAGFSLDEASQKAHSYSEKFEYFHNMHLIDEVTEKEGLLTNITYKEILENIHGEENKSSAIEETAEYLQHKLQNHLSEENNEVESKPESSNHFIDLNEILFGWLPFGKTAAQENTNILEPSDVLTFSSQPYEAHIDTALPYAPPPNPIAEEEAATPIW